jgi:predicted transcriptional regulator
MESLLMFYGVLEIEIMNVLWHLQEQDEDANISVSDIVSVLNDNNIERAYTTVKTVMDRLVLKDILVRYRINKKFFYKSTIDKHEAARNTINNVSNQFFAGNHIQMLRFIEKECEHLLIV